MSVLLASKAYDCLLTVVFCLPDKIFPAAKPVGPKSQPLENAAAMGDGDNGKEKPSSTREEQLMEHVLATPVRQVDNRSQSVLFCTVQGDFLFRI